MRAWPGDADARHVGHLGGHADVARYEEDALLTWRRRIHGGRNGEEVP